MADESGTGDTVRDGAGLFSDDERGIADRGLAPVAPTHAGFKTFAEMPQISALRGPGPATADIFAFDEALTEAKEAWKAAHPTWPFDATLRNTSGFIFGDEEIRAGLFDWLGYVPGPIGLVATVLSLVNVVKQQAAAGGQSALPMWEIVAQIVVQISTAVLAKKLKAKEARALLTKAFQRLGLDDLVAARAVAVVKSIQDIANRTFRQLAKSSRFKALSKSSQGIEWDKIVKEELTQLQAQELKGTGFRIRFEEPLALGSGQHHPGPNIDVVLLYRQTRIARIELKLSLKAIDPTRTQTFMVVNDALSLDLVELFLTPTTLVLMPDIDNGYPVPLSLLR